ncbi:MAG: tRNA threonylcarbamoyladenosine dehydratase [Bacteroidota bacterium]
MQQHTDWLQRTKLLLDNTQMQKLQNAHVLVVGLGGVGGYAAEQLVRAGIGNMTVVDGDTVNESNLNRQVVALHSTIGQEKATVLGQRLKDINPRLNLSILNEFLRDERAEEVLETNFDYVVDAIDTLAPKIFLIYHTMQRGYPLVSSMGSGGKFDPLQIKIDDFSNTFNCKLAYVLRKKLRKLDVAGGFKAVFSTEQIDKTLVVETDEQNKKSIVGTISYMPPLFGCAIASVVIRDIAGIS